MTNVEPGSRGRMGRGVWLLVGTLASLGVAGLLALRVPEHRERARAEPHASSTDQSAEIDRLKAAVGLLERKSEALAVAVSSPARAPEPARGGEPVQASAEIQD